MRSILEHILDDDATEGVFRWSLNVSLEKIGKSLKGRLAEIMLPHLSSHPITYNQTLTELVRERRLKQQEKELHKIIKDSVTDDKWVPEGILFTALRRKAKRDLDRDASSDAVDWMEAYYDVRQMPPS
ncbi:hypothetical protein IMZ48_18695 [Candidatus Bathyarchaeota archaeon]|nr:hypothetical protein [Candidatus Bathyarchaeota archaeon]